jgi:hypothetical protein
VAPAVPLACVLALPLSAHAAIDPGVNYDPGSPAGKEYAIPLVQGRAIGAGTDNQRAAAGIAFGAGIKPPSGGAGTGGSHRPGHGSGSGHGAKGGGAKTGKGALGSSSSSSPLASLTPRERQRLLNAEQPGGTGLLTAGIALAVLLPALLVAVLLRRRPEQPAS